MVFNLVFKHFNHILMYFVLCLKHLSNDTSNDSKCHILYFIFICNGLMILLNQSLIYNQRFLISWKYENIVYTIWLWPYLLLYLQQHACLKVYSRWDQVFERWNRSHQTIATGDKLRRMTRLEIKNDVLKIALSKIDNSLFWRIDWWIFPIKTKFYNVK